MKFIQPNIFLYFFLLLLGISGFFFPIIWPQTLGFYIFIAFAAMGGLGVALYIYHTKKSNKQLVCPVGSNCNAVINSQYSKFLGISLEYWGMFYYSVIIASYIILILAGNTFPKFLLFGLSMFTASAFLFSLYLLFAQAFLLRQWCIWCLLSAALSITIFITSLISLDFALTFLAESMYIVEVIHALGFSLGLGGATATFFLLFKFLRDRDIDESELQVLKGISEIIWIGLVFVLVSQFISFVVYPEVLSKIGPFIAQTISLFVIAISSAILMIIFAPFLEMIPFDKTLGEKFFSPLGSLRKPLFITGAIAFSSWYFAFFMNYVPKYNLTKLFGFYIIILIGSVIASIFWEKNL